jgi:hypothetical protein
MGYTSDNAKKQLLKHGCKKTVGVTSTLMDKKQTNKPSDEKYLKHERLNKPKKKY